MLRSKHYGIGLALAAVFASSGCSGGDAGKSDTGMAVSDTGAMMGDTGMAMAPMPAAAMSDANIVYVLDQSNLLDSVSGAIAATKGTNSEVREFARMMMRDHHALRRDGQALAKKLAVTPAAPGGDNSKAESDRVMSMLNNAAKGRDFDKAYIDDQVTYHVNLLATATSVMAAAQNPELKNFIQKAAPTVQAHLDRVQAIQRTLQ